MGSDTTEPLGANYTAGNASLTNLEFTAGPGTPEESPYHILSNKQKWHLVYIVSMAGMLSPLASNIYFPAIDTISQDLGSDASLVALTITIYMVVQGLAPSFWGPLADGQFGRRLTFILTLSLFSIANLGLAFTANYPMLLVLRGIQAAGSAATISIGTGVIADIALPSERGGFIGTNSGIRMIAQALGPFIGGVFNGIWGFRSVFWFLFVLGCLILLALVTFLPETQRSIAGDGSVPLYGVHRPLVYLYTEPRSSRETSEDNTRPQSQSSMFFKQIVVPFKTLCNKDVAVLLFYGALVYAVWSMVTSSTTTVLLREFPSLTDLELGLCFLPNGMGCVLGSVLTGKIMDYNYRRVEKRYKLENGIDLKKRIKGDPNIPYEHARLAPMPYLTVVFILSVFLYGASYELNDINRFAVANLIISLLLQFFIAYTATATFSINSALLVDCFPRGAAGATAVNNLARCTLGAIGVSVIQPMIDAIHIRNTFFILGGIVLLFSPLVWVEWKWGQGWRMDREKLVAMSQEMGQVEEGKGKGTEKSQLGDSQSA